VFEGRLQRGGSTASQVTALIASCSPTRSFQWNGAKQLPGNTRSLSAPAAAPGHGASGSPPGPCRRCPGAGVVGVDLDEGAGLQLVQAGTLPVLVRVCHWCCTRPVLSTMG
jgi:hypothetical protein